MTSYILVTDDPGRDIWCIDFPAFATVTFCNVSANFIYHGAVGRALPALQAEVDPRPGRGRGNDESAAVSIHRFISVSLP